MEIGRRSVVVERRGHPEFAGGARLLLLLRHRGIESGDRVFAVSGHMGIRALEDNFRG